MSFIRKLNIFEVAQKSGVPDWTRENRRDFKIDQRRLWVLFVDIFYH